MTEADLKATWQRWMHRNDISADLDKVLTFAQQHVNERLMRDDTDVDEILISSPLLLVHGGLIYLHQMTQDDEGLMRENQLFEQAAQNYAFKYSIDNETPKMVAS